MNNAGAGNNNIESPESFKSRLDELGGITLARDIRLYSNGFATGILDVLEDAINVIFPRSTTATLAPNLAKYLAVASPIPLPAPVTNTVLPLISIVDSCFAVDVGVR